MFSMLPILGYFSPETMLPLSSVIATIVGFGLLIKRSSIRFIVGCCRAAFRRRGPRSSVGAPHFTVASQEVREQSQA
jgi:hypothetical protein